jgi:hypothetical protein
MIASTPGRSDTGVVLVRCSNISAWAFGETVPDYMVFLHEIMNIPEERYSARAELPRQQISLGIVSGALPCRVCL